MPGRSSSNDWILREFETSPQYTYSCFSIHIQSNTSALLCDFWQGYSIFIMLNWNVPGRCLLCNNQTVCTVICDNHSTAFSCKNYTHNTLLMLTRNTNMQYIIYFFIIIFVAQSCFSIIYGINFLNWVLSQKLISVKRK